jgi:hypothetical protein
MSTTDEPELMVESRLVVKGVSADAYSVTPVVGLMVVPRQYSKPEDDKAQMDWSRWTSSVMVEPDHVTATEAVVKA